VNCSRSRVSSRQPNIQNINCPKGRVGSGLRLHLILSELLVPSRASSRVQHTAHGPGHLFNFTFMPSLSPIPTTTWTTYFQSSFPSPHILRALLLCQITSMTRVSKTRLKPLRRFPNLNYCCRRPVVNMSWM
jgi:hypothetical protein